MSDNTLESQSWPVNELGEIVFTTGTGSTNIIGYTPSVGIPTDPRTNRVKAVIGAAALETATPTTPLTIYLKEGNTVKFTSNSAIGVITKYVDQSNTVDTAQNVIAGSAYSYGPYSGSQKFVITCSSGSIDASVGDAAVGSARFMTGSQALFRPDGTQWHDVTYSSNTVADVTMKTYLQSAGIISSPAYIETTPTLIAGTRYYIDPISGSDTGNTGLSPASPWQNLTKIIGLNPSNGAVIHLASDGVFEYPESIATYMTTGRLFPSNGCDNLRSSNASAPIVIKPYNARPTAGSKPIIRYYGTIAASDWTQETGLGLGPNIWSFSAGTANPTIYDFALAYGSSNIISVGAHQQVNGVAYSPGNDPAQLKNIGDVSLKTGQTKIYCYCPANPTTYFGSVKIIGLRPVFASSWQGLNNVKLYNLQFELCSAMSMSTVANLSTPVVGLDVAFCTFKKAHVGYFNNQMTYASATECEVKVHDCYLEDTYGSAIRVRTGGFDGSTGTAGNTFSWEVYRNTLNRGNLHSSNGGALAYIQAYGGTKHHVWGNYIFGAKNGTGGNNVDGAAIYSDVDCRNIVMTGNIAEQCGIGFQMNITRNGHVSANLAIDCLMFGLFTGVSSNSYPNQNFRVIHNTWLWTGRVAPSSIQSAPGMGINNYAFREYIDTTGGGTSKLDVLIVNNLAVMVSEVGFTSKGAFSYISSSGQTNAFLAAGQAAIGFSTANKIVVDNGTDVSGVASALTYNGPASDAFLCMSDPANGSAVLSPSSLLTGHAPALSVAYTDIRGRSFSTIAPTPGCYESQ